VTEFPNDLKGHDPNSVQRGWVIAQPKSLQETAFFSSDFKTLDMNKPLRNNNAMPRYPGPHVDNCATRK
jgi:translation elongation factor EF-Tu-like GTPase